MKFDRVVVLAALSRGAWAFSQQKCLLSRTLAYRRQELVSIRPARPASTTTTLFGILDEINSDAFNLLSSSSSNAVDDDAELVKAYDVFLAELVFSTNDPRVDIMNKIELASDPKFIEWLEKKFTSSKDPEERVALKDLHEMIVDIKTRVEVNRLAEERALKEAEEAEKALAAELASQQQEDSNISTADILKRAKAIDSAAYEKEQQQAKKEKKSFYDQELTPEIRLSYETLLTKVLPPYQGGETAATVVFNYYSQFDAQFVKLLNERSTNGDAASTALLEALAIEQQRRISEATATLKSVLSLGEPMRMEGSIVKLAREGKIDEAFLLLLEANEDQAKKAGANGPAQLMNRLRMRAAEEKDKQASSKEIRLLRKLLRTEDAAERERIIEEAFTPREALIVPGTMENAQKAADGEQPDQAKALPDVPPPDFINACKAVLLNFGNLGSDDEPGSDLASRIKKLASEAEVVATRIYGQGMTVREQQDRMWKEQTTSIFDLERMEIDAERRGEKAPWANPNEDDFFLPGFDKDGRMQVGGG